MKRKYEKAQEMRDEQFHRLFGFSKNTMLAMIEILREVYAAKHRRRGRHSKLDVAAESTAHDITVWVENVLIKSGKYGLPGKKLLTSEKLEVILVDVTESPVERPKYGQKRRYSGKKKRHTIKSQMVICAMTRMIIDVFVDCGSTHDFKIWKKSIGVKVIKHIKIQADSGYQGIEKLHENSETPKKKSKKHPLTKDEKSNLTIVLTHDTSI